MRTLKRAAWLSRNLPVLWPAMRNLGATLLESMMPNACVLCQQALIRRTQHKPAAMDTTCPYCLGALARNIRACLTCARPVTSTRHLRCPQCRSLAYKGLCIASLLYDETTRHLVHRMKFHDGYREAKLLSYLMATHIVEVYASLQSPLPALLMPVPLSQLNLAVRGFNQATHLAHQLGRQLAIPLDAQTLARRHGPPQRHKTRTQRQQLPSASFSLRRPAPSSSHIAIVDDVMTSGRTTEIIRTHLQANGVDRVDIWCAARVV